MAGAWSEAQKHESKQVMKTMRRSRSCFSKDWYCWRLVEDAVGLLVLCFTLMPTPGSAALFGKGKTSEPPPPVFTNIAPPLPPPAQEKRIQRDVNWGPSAPSSNGPALNVNPIPMSPPVDKAATSNPPAASSQQLQPVRVASAPIRGPVVNEAPFCFAYMPDGALFLNGRDFKERLGYMMVRQLHEKQQTLDRSTLESAAAIVVRNRYGNSPMKNSWAALVLLQMAYNVIEPNASALLLNMDPAVFANYEQELPKQLNEFERRRLLERRLPFYTAQLTNATSIRRVRFLTEHSISGEYSFQRGGYFIEPRQFLDALFTFTNKVQFPEPKFIAMAEAEAEELRRPGDVVTFVFEYEGDLVSSGYQQEMAKQHKNPSALGIEVSSLRIHVVRQTQLDDQTYRVITKELPGMRFSADR